MRAEPSARGGEKPIQELPIRREHDPGSVEIRGIVIFETRPHNMLRIEDIDPCAIGRHRPAWLNSGGAACGRCGASL